MIEPGKASAQQSAGDIAELWRHVAALRPRLRHHVRLLNQEFRGERWYLLHDESSGLILRFDSLAHELIGRMDGDLTVREIVERAKESVEGGLETDGVLEVMARLHAAEVLDGSLPLGANEALARYRRVHRQRRSMRWASPLAMRLSLFDPDRLLERCVPLARALFTRTGLIVWLGVVCLATVVALGHRAEIGTALGALQLDASDMAVFWLTFPLLKALHEIGHALAVKTWGGEVHEMGISLLVFVPVPYVDASAALAFRDKRRRVLVSATGILVEMLVAALALLAWIAIEPGLLRDVALAFAVLGSLSTLLCNANPLLRFDGYHMLEDLVEIPDLSRRASRYWLYLIQRHVLGLERAASPVTARGERPWFLVYGLLAPLYRVTVLFAIALYLSGKFLVVGIMLASWAVLMQLIKPLLLGLRFLLSKERLGARRGRAVALVALACCALGAILLLPAPLVTRAEGVVWPADGGQILGPSEGFVVEVYVASGERVSAGQPLLRLRDPELDTRVEIVRARLEEAQVRRAAEAQLDRTRGAMVNDEIRVLEAERARLEERRAEQLVRSPLDGVFVHHDPHHLPGRYIRNGDPLGYVLDPDGAPIVRAVFDQRDAGLMGSGPLSVEVTLAARPDKVLPASLVRDFPAGTRRLPSAALGTLGGGRLRIDPGDPSGRTADREVFQLDLELPEASEIVGVGERARVKLDHGREALWRRLARRARQLFLGIA